MAYEERVTSGRTEIAFISLAIAFLAMFVARITTSGLGILAGVFLFVCCFFIFYAVGRIAVENFREPDAEHIAGMTRGQFYSLFMIVVGIAFLAYGLVKKRKNRLPA